MAHVVHIDNEDSQSSIVEIEAPKKPAPLVIDLADEEIIINVKADIPSTPLSPGVPWVSQYDHKTGNLGESIEDDDDEENKENINNEAKDNEVIEEENDDVVEEENDEENEDENGENDVVIKDENEENEEVVEDGNEEKIEVLEDENEENVEVLDDENEENEGNEEVLEDENEENEFIVKDEIKSNEEDEKVAEDDNEENEKAVEDENEENEKNEGVVKNENEEVTENKNEENGDNIDKNDEAIQDVIKIKDEQEREPTPTDNEKHDEDNEGNDNMTEQEKVGKETETKGNGSNENKNDKKDKEKKDETSQGDKARQDDRAREDIQSQPGPSNFDPQATHSRGPYSLASFSQPSFSQASFSQAPFSRPSVSRPPYLHNPYELLTANPPREDPGPHHPDHWTPEMVKFYDEDWGNEKEFVVEKLQEGMDKDPSLWEISSRDVAYWRNKDKKPTTRCYNCFDCGHESYDCPEEERVPKCHMCGTSGHIAYKCPDSLCLNCGTATTGYVTKCKNCTFGLDKVCERCNLTGHIYSECTDHWRLYHSTIGTKRVDLPRHDIYKPIRNRWCCNCGRQGHLQVECDFCVKNCEFSDTLPFVSSYIKAFTRGTQLAYGYEEPEGPKRLKIDVEDNIMTNPSQKHIFQRKTSQLRNKLKALARERNANADRRRPPGGGFNRFNLF